jgi:hypothetical protein
MAVAKGERMESWLLHKAAHTFAVAGTAEEIILCDDELAPLLRDEAEKDNAIYAAILHDLGRFYQHKDGVKLENSEFDHGRKAVELLSAMHMFDDPAILFAIDEHDEFAIDFANPYYAGLPENRKPASALIARLLRDADKLENIRNMRIWRDNFHAGEKAPLSVRMRKAIEIGGPASYNDGQNSTDEAAAVLSWIADLEFGYTRGAVKKSGFLEAGLGLMKERGATDGDVELVRAHYGKY